MLRLSGWGGVTPKAGNHSSSVGSKTLPSLSTLMKFNPSAERAREDSASRGPAGSELTWSPLLTYSAASAGAAENSNCESHKRGVSGLCSRQPPMRERNTGEYATSMTVETKHGRYSSLEKPS